MESQENPGAGWLRGQISFGTMRELKKRALTIRIGFRGVLYYNYNKGTPKPYSNY